MTDHETIFRTSLARCHNGKDYAEYRQTALVFSDWLEEQGRELEAKVTRLEWINTWTCKSASGVDWCETWLCVMPDGCRAIDFPSGFVSRYTNAYRLMHFQERQLKLLRFPGLSSHYAINGKRFPEPRLVAAFSVMKGPRENLILDTVRHSKGFFHFLTEPIWLKAQRERFQKLAIEKLSADASVEAGDVPRLMGRLGNPEEGEGVGSRLSHAPELPWQEEPGHFR